MGRDETRWTDRLLDRVGPAESDGLDVDQPTDELELERVRDRRGGVDGGRGGTWWNQWRAEMNSR